jgi:hypothetical protein
MTCMFPMAAATVVLIFALPGIAPAAEPPGASFVAGLAPHQRPKGAPTIREFASDPSWRAQALTGIAEPVPPSLGFLSNQGAWYTPFNRPGMPGYYDLRQWYGNAVRATTNAAR